MHGAYNVKLILCIITIYHYCKYRMELWKIIFCYGHGLTVKRVTKRKPERTKHIELRTQKLFKEKTGNLTL